jgi:metal-responsive CopG/Arc/MetJ family transcriptional regulator
MKHDIITTGVSITTNDLLKLDQMASEDAYLNRSYIIRKLIRQEWERRHQPVRLISDAVGVDQDVNSLS